MKRKKNPPKKLSQPFDLPDERRIPVYGQPPLSPGIKVRVAIAPVIYKI